MLNHEAQAQNKTISKAHMCNMSPPDVMHLPVSNSVGQLRPAACFCFVQQQHTNAVSDVGLLQHLAAWYRLYIYETTAAVTDDKES